MNDLIISSFKEEMEKQGGLVSLFKNWKATRTAAKDLEAAARTFYSDEIRAGRTANTIDELIKETHSAVKNKGTNNPHVRKFLDAREEIQLNKEQPIRKFMAPIAYGTAAAVGTNMLLTKKKKPEYNQQ